MGGLGRHEGRHRRQQRRLGRQAFRLLAARRRGGKLGPSRSDRIRIDADRACGFGIESRNLDLPVPGETWQTGSSGGSHTAAAQHAVAIELCVGNRPQHQGDAATEHNEVD